MLYIHRFKFLDADQNEYKLRYETLSAVSVQYRFSGSEDSFTRTQDFNIDEQQNILWARLPVGELEVVINLSVEPLRTITSGLQTLTFPELSSSYEVVMTPAPVDSHQGFSPRIIDGYWYAYDDTLQTFYNTGVQAKGTVIEEGTVVDFAQNGNMNAITSNAVNVINNNIRNELNVINQSVTNINNKVEAVSAKSYSVKMNGEEHKADDAGVIDLGHVDVRGNTRTLTTQEEVNGTLLPKGTLLDENENVLATDGYYYYKYRTAIDVDERYVMTVAMNKSCRLDVRYSVYNNVRFGTIFVSKNGYDYEFSCSNSGLAQVVKFYRFNSIADPVLIFPAGNQFVNGTVAIQSTEELIKRSGAITPNSEQLYDVYPFLTSYKKDRITVDSTPFDVNNLLITDFVVNIESAEVNFTDLLNEPVTLTFSNNTTTTTTVTVEDGEFETTSSELAPGEVAILVFSNKNNFIWNTEEHVQTEVTSVNGMTGDVVIDTYTLEVEGGVKTVDGQSPDTNGNVALLPLYKNGLQVRKEWPAYNKYDLDYDNDRRSYVNNNGTSNDITSMSYGNIILTGSYLSQRTNFVIPTTLSAYSTYGDYMKWTVYNATTASEQIPINDTEVYIGDKIEVVFNKYERKVFVFGSNGKLKLTIDLT